MHNNNRDYSNKPINNNNNNSSFNRPLIKCNYCNRNGHLEKDCFKKKKTQPPMTPNRKDERKDTKFNQIYCLRERKVKDDSKINDKRITINSVIEEKKSEELFVVIGKINNKEAKILIDTGSNKNFISRKMVKKIGVKPQKTNDKITVNLGIKDVARIPDLRVTLPVEIQGVNVNEVSFNILDSHDAILGYEWFKKHMIPTYATPSEEKKEENKVINNNDKKSTPNPNPIHLNRIMISYKRTKKELKKGAQLFITYLRLRNEEEVKHGEEPWVHELLSEYKDQFTDEIPRYNSDIEFEHKIDLKSGATVPKRKFYRLTPNERKIMNDQIKELLENGLIQPSQSPFGAPIVSAKKSDGTMRMCIDYRELNERTILNRYPLPNIQELFDIIGRAKYYTKLDLKSGYHQFKVALDSIQYTAFCTPSGHYEWLVMPFGLMNAPSTFQSAMNDLLREYLNKFVVVYLDDILIFSDSEEEHKEHVKMILDLMKKHNLKLAKKKCEFNQREIEYLGHKLGDGKISPTDQKLKIIKEWERTTNTKEVQSFLGFVNYYHKFIKNFAEIAIPLYTLSRKDVKFTWKKEQEDAFNQLKDKLLLYQELICPDVNKPFIVIPTPAILRLALY